MSGGKDQLTGNGCGRWETEMRFRLINEIVIQQDKKQNEININLY